MTPTLPLGADGPLPVRTAVISPFTLKSSSTFSSRRALRSSASLSIFWVDPAGASTSKGSGEGGFDRRG